DALRMRFERIDGQWRQHNAGLEPVEILTVVDLPSQPKQSKQPQQTFQPRQPAQHGQPAHPREPRLSPAMEAMEAIVDRVHAGFGPARGPLFKAVLFRLGEGQRPLLFLVAHHLVVDAVSWRILLDDLDVAYARAVRGEPVDLGAKTTSFQDWSTRLRE